MPTTAPSIGEGTARTNPEAFYRALVQLRRDMGRTAAERPLRRRLDAGHDERYHAGCIGLHLELEAAAVAAARSVRFAGD